MGLFKALFPDNYIPVPRHHTDSQMASTANSPVGYLDRSGKDNRISGAADAVKFREECLKRETQLVREDWARKDAAANDARWSNALYYAYHPDALRATDNPPDPRLLAVAKDFIKGR